MSSIGAEIIEAEEVEAFEDKFREQWRQDTLKMLELSEQWNGVYQQIDVKQDTESDSPPF